MIRLVIALVLSLCMGCTGKSSSSDTPTNKTSDATGSPAVVAVANLGQCMDGPNEWGNSLRCACPGNFNYNPVNALCEGTGDAPEGSTVVADRGLVSSPPEGSCAPDFNAWGAPSICECPAGKWYNAVSGLCDKKN